MWWYHINYAARSYIMLHEGHIGIVKMKGLARSYVWWPGIDQDRESLAKKCQGCQKVQFEAPTVPLHPWEWPI